MTFSAQGGMRLAFHHLSRGGTFGGMRKSIPPSTCYCAFRWSLHKIIRGNRAFTPETALRLGLYFGNQPEFWRYLQTQYDLAELRKSRGAQIAREVARAA